MSLRKELAPVSKQRDLACLRRTEITPMPISAEAVAATAYAVPSPKLEPPVTLALEATKIWHEIVGRLPAEWFSADNAPLLEQLCNHTVFARRLAADIEALRNVPLDDFE